MLVAKPNHLSTKNEQIVLTNKESSQQIVRPIMDLGVLILEDSQVTITLALIQKLAKENVAVIFCDEKHLPASMLFHLDTHYIQNERFRYQLAASVALKKQLWQQTIKMKITNQALLLAEISSPVSLALKKLAKEVKSGDTTNCEAEAARLYWQALFGENFRRDPEGMPPNPSLNYAYAILRGATARALAVSGLLPTLGIFHRNRYNDFCLADDIMEPYRPFADRIVWQMMQDTPDYHVLHKDNKVKLISVLHHDTHFEDQTSPLMIALQRTASSLARCFEGKARKIVYPNLPLDYSNQSIQQ